MSIYRWDIEVRTWNTYGDRIVRRTPMSILACSRSEVTDKVRAAFEATHDDFRKFWSHSWALISITEEPTTADEKVSA